MAIKLFEQLNIEWARLVKARTSAAALADWQQEDTALHGLHDFADVLDVALGDDRCRADAVLRALLRTEQHRSTAQRIVLQTVMPGLVGATNRYRNGPAAADDRRRRSLATHRRVPPRPPAPEHRRQHRPR